MGECGCWLYEDGAIHCCAEYFKIGAGYAEDRRQSADYEKAQHIVAAVQRLERERRDAQAGVGPTTAWPSADEIRQWRTDYLSVRVPGTDSYWPNMLHEFARWLRERIGAAVPAPEPPAIMWPSAEEIKRIWELEGPDDGPESAVWAVQWLRERALQERQPAPSVDPRVDAYEIAYGEPPDRESERWKTFCVGWHGHVQQTWKAAKES